jgi:hypothetical protein
MSLCSTSEEFPKAFNVFNYNAHEVFNPDFNGMKDIIVVRMAVWAFMSSRFIEVSEKSLCNTGISAK